MTHPVCPIVRHISQQEQHEPIEPGTFQRKEGEVLKQKLVGTNGEYLQKQSRQLTGDAAAQVCDRIRQPVQLLVREPLHNQFNAHQDEKDGYGKHNRVYVQGVLLFICGTNLRT